MPLSECNIRIVIVQETTSITDGVGQAKPNPRCELCSCKAEGQIGYLMMVKIAGPETHGLIRWSLKESTRGIEKYMNISKE